MKNSIMNSNRKHYLSLIIAFAIGLLVPLKQYFICKDQLFSTLNMSEDIFNDTTSILINTNLSLQAAQHIRDSNLQAALTILEDNIQVQVESFTNKGRDFKRLSEWEVETYQDVKAYWESSCTKQCLTDLEYMFYDKYGYHSKQ